MKQQWNRIGMVSALALVMATGQLWAAEPAADPYATVVSYKFGESRVALVQIEEEVRKASLDQYPAIETKLLGVLQAPAATDDAKGFACRVLRQVGSAKCVPAVEKLLPDAKLSHMARWALQDNQSAAAGTALRRALRTTRGDQLLGVIGSVGARGDRTAVGELAGLVKGADPKAAGAAITALGRIGGKEAAAVVARLKPSAGSQGVWLTAYIGCADSTAREKDAAAAGKMYRFVFDGKYPETFRVAALIGLVRTGNIRATELLAVMKGGDSALPLEAARLIGGMTDEATVNALVEQLAGLTPATQVVILSSVVEADNKAAARAVPALVESPDAAVREAAFAALGKMGDETSVPVLLRVAVGTEKTAATAFTSLVQLRGEKVAGALVAALKGPDAATRAKAIEVFAARADRARLPDILTACNDSDANVRSAATRAIRTLGDDKLVPQLVSLLVASQDDAFQRDLEQTIVVLAMRGGDAEAVTAPVIAKLGTSEKADARLLAILGKRGGAAALAAVRKYAQNPNLELRKAAVRALADWSDATPMEELFALAQSEQDPGVRAAAMRGYVRMVGEGSKRSEKEMIALYEKALKTTTQPAELKQVLGALATVKSVEALKLVSQYFGNEAVSVEACTTGLTICEALAKAQPAEVGEALETIAEVSHDADLRKRAQDMGGKLSGLMITTWMVAGPFTAAGKNGAALFDQVFPPEEPNATGVAWKAIQTGADGMVDLARVAGGGDDRVAYLRVRIDAAREQKVHLSLGSDDGVKVWLNGKPVLAKNAARPVQLGDEQADLSLTSGTNVLLLKITQGSGEWAAVARLSPANGGSVREIKLKAE